MFALALTLVLSQPTSATVLFAGDVTLGYHYEEYVDELIKKGTPVAEAQGWGFNNVRARTTAADLFVVNLECPFTARGEKIAKNFNFRARPDLVAALEAGGVDVVSIANNHMMDYGAEGLFDTLSTLEQHKIPSFGAARNLSAARAPRIVTVNGIKVAFVGYFFLGDRNIEPKEVIATATTPGVAGEFSDLSVMKKMVAADVRAAKSKADHVIPFFHWGREGRAEPEPYQVELAHVAIEAGASAVIGSHPHVLQTMETYKGAPIVYSLGNFVFGGNWDPKDKRTALIELTITKDAVAKVDVVPAFSDAYPTSPAQPYFADEDAGVSIRERLRGGK